MVAQGKVKRYLLYAVGEITLLVIGILIALQLNNLNDLSKNAKLERTILSGIVENLEVEIVDIGSHLETQEERFLAYTVMLRAFTDSSVRNDTDTLKWAIIRAQWVTDYEAHRNVFDGLESSGRLNLIKSDDLRREIQEYYVWEDAVIKAESGGHVQ
jgi:hypothetical protein